MAGQRHTRKFESNVSDNKIAQTKMLKIMTQPELGKKITELRKANGLTQEELVEKCNISVRTIQRIESGEVTPRSYTVRTILAALGHDIKDISVDYEHQDGGFGQWIKRQFLLNIDFQKPSNLIIHQLNIAWIFGAIYFITGFFEGSADFIRYSENRLIFHPAIYIIIKIVVLISFTAFQRGFVVIGGMFKNYLLTVSSVIIIFGVLLTTILDIASLYNEEIYSKTTLGGMGITFGVLGIIFGIALIRLRKNAGELALATGIFQIFSGFFFMTLILAILGFIILIPAELFGIVLIYKILATTKSKLYDEQNEVTETSPGYVV